MAFKSFFVNSLFAAWKIPKPITVPRQFKITSSTSKHPLNVMSWIISINNEKLKPATTVFHIFFHLQRCFLQDLLLQILCGNEGCVAAEEGPG